MRDRYLLTPADIRAQDDAQAARDFWWMTALLGLTLALLVGMLVYAIRSIQP